MERLIYVPPGGDYNDPMQRVMLAAEEPFIVSKIKGLGGLETEIISSQTAAPSGEYYQGCRTPPRPIRCTVNVRGADRADMYRQRMRLIGLLRPQAIPGTLYYENDYIAVRISAVPRIPPDFEKRIRNYNEADISFYCPQPEWISLDEQQESIAFIENSGFQLPLSFSPNGISFCYTQSDLDIDYVGTAPAPVRITVLGPSDQPVIRNETTGRHIRIQRALSDGEILVINTEKGRKSVMLQTDDTVINAFGYIDPTSKFWELQPGVNHITYGDDEQVQTSIYINYYIRYAGV